MRAIGGVALFTVTLAATPVAQADDHCNGPEACCPSTLAESFAAPVQVNVGVVLLGLYNVNEKGATWDADYYLYEKWQPTKGFTPQTEIVNEVEHHDERFDDISLRHGYCIRTRRMHSTLHNEYNLRLFPFDRQRLRVVFSDAKYESTSVDYLSTPYTIGLADQARRSLSSWKIESELVYSRQQTAFAWEEDAPKYDYAEFEFQIRRHVTYHLIKYFLPLLLIVCLSFLVFWIDPEDLPSQVSIGVTCVLSAIAFQLVQASSLPEVAYTTLADRFYVVCYVAITLAQGQSVYTNALVRKGRKPSAMAIDRACRWLFPAITSTLLIIVSWWSFAQS